MKERPGAQTPWAKVNSLLAPDERFGVILPHWQGFLFAPKHSSQLAALFYLLHQEEIVACIQGKGTQAIPKGEQRVIVSARAFSQMVWHEQGVVEVGAGCSLTHLHAFLFERNQEVALEDDPLASSKRSVAGLILSGRTGGIRYRSEGMPENILGVELVTTEGNQVKWGAHQRSAVAGPALSKLIWGLQTLPGMIVKFMLKTYPLPPMRLQLAWAFRQKEALWKQLADLKQFCSSWEYVDILLSGNPADQGFIFAQISGFPEQMEAFSQECPHFTLARQQGERWNFRKFLNQQKLKSYLVPVDHSLNPGEYLWIQDGRQGAWWLTTRLIEEKEGPSPIWKQRLWASLASFKK